MTRLLLSLSALLAARCATEDANGTAIHIPMVHFALRDLTLLLHQLSTPLLARPNSLLFNWGRVHSASVRSIPGKRTVAGVELPADYEMLWGESTTNVCGHWNPPASCLRGMSRECLLHSVRRWGGDESDVFLSDTLEIGHVRVPSRASMAQLRHMAVEIGCNPFVEEVRLSLASWQHPCLAQISGDAVLTKHESSLRSLGRVPSPNDSKYSQQWYIKDQKITDAWTVTKGDKGIVVMVIDTGVDYNHQDIKGNMWVNNREGNNFNQDADSENCTESATAHSHPCPIEDNGYKGDKHGINSSDGTGNCMDGEGHGTHMAGIIGAVTNNGVGIAGINWAPKIVCCKFMGDGTKVSEVVARPALS